MTIAAIGGIEAIERKYMRIDEVARRLGIHPQSVRVLRQRGAIRQRLVGGKAFFDREEIERFALTYENKPGRPRQGSMRFDQRWRARA